MSNQEQGGSGMTKSANLSSLPIRIVKFIFSFPKMAMKFSHINVVVDEAHTSTSIVYEIKETSKIDAECMNCE